MLMGDVRCVVVPFLKPNTLSKLRLRFFLKKKQAFILRGHTQGYKVVFFFFAKGYKVGLCRLWLTWDLLPTRPFVVFPMF